MKKFLAVLLASIMALACVSFAGAETEFDPELVKAAQEEGELVVYGSCEEEYLEAACDGFSKLFGIKVTHQRLSTGEVQSKIEEENGNPSADVWFGGTTDPYNICAKNGLLQTYEAKNAVHLLGPAYRDADGALDACRARTGRRRGRHVHHHVQHPGRHGRRADHAGKRHGDRGAC